MKKRTIYSWMLSLSLLAGSITLNSCRDTFTEEQVLKEQQTIDLAITAFDRYENKGLAGATVSFQQDGQKVEQTTNELGVANFGDVKIGSNLIVTITKDGFATTRQTISTMVDNFRVSQLSRTADMYATDGISTAIIRGKAEIETDVTNNKSETVPANTPVEAYMKLDGPNGINEISIKGQVDANGMYSLKVPATKEGLAYKLIFPTLELDQKIAKNGNQGETKWYPEVLPTVENIKTVFATSGPGLTVPSVLRPVYALATPNGTDATVTKRPATIWVNIANDGTLQNIYIEDAGSGYTGIVTLDIQSLLGGSGAVVKVQSMNGQLTGAITYESRGSGYPPIEEANLIHRAENIGNNSGIINPRFTQEVGTKSGDIKIINVHYGTGTNRATEIR
jgi:hypothetical protein